MISLLQKTAIVKLHQSISHRGLKFCAGTVFKKFNLSSAETHYVLYSCDSKSELTNKNFVTIENVEGMGNAALAKGTSAVAFSCEHGKYEMPEISVRFITKGEPDKITSE